jgi:hypothetical protein
MPKFNPNGKAVYGSMFDLTGEVCKPKKLKVNKQTGQVEFPDGTVVKRLGQQSYGDGRAFRVTYAAYEMDPVRKWFSGANDAFKLLRPTFTVGK